jgi:hypothetical protein
MIEPAIRQALDQVGATIDDIGFVCSGSSDYLAGQAFSFVMTLDAVGAWPPISESHVEMDGAWALYEAWLKIQSGHCDTALVFGYSKASPGDLPRVLTRQLDPYYYGPLWPDSVALAGLQARAMLDAGAITEAEMAQIAERNRTAAKDNPNAQLQGSPSVDELLTAPFVADPLRRHDCAPITDGGVAMIIAADDAARKFSSRPAWIRGIDHRVDSHNLGARDLTRAPSIALAAQHAGVADGKVEMLLNAGDHEHMRVAFIEALGTTQYDVVDTMDGVYKFAENLRKGGTPDKPITLFAFKDYFPAVATTDVLSRIADVLCCKPSELAFYPVPKLMIRRVGDHEAYSALRASELGDGTLELREVPDALAYINLMEKGPELLINMNECIVKNNQIGLYDGCKNAVLLAQELASSSSSLKPSKSPARASKSPARK